jgi:hypothetical protein
MIIEQFALSPSLSPYEVLYSPLPHISSGLISLFERWLRMGEADFSNGLAPERNAIPILKMVKGLGFFPQFFPHPKFGGKCCRISHLQDGIIFEASGRTQEEAIIRACALAVMAHRSRQTA